MVVGCHTVLTDFYLYSFISMKCKWQIGTLFNCDFSNKGYLLKNYVVKEFKRCAILEGFGFRVTHKVMWFVSSWAPIQNAAHLNPKTVLDTGQCLIWTLSESEILGTFWVVAVIVVYAFLKCHSLVALDAILLMKLCFNKWFLLGFSHPSAVRETSS